jgi:hypothetical protein
MPVIEKRRKTFEPQTKRDYVPPRIVRYSREDILEKIGPAQACSPTVCPVAP